MAPWYSCSASAGWPRRARKLARFDARLGPVGVQPLRRDVVSPPPGRGARGRPGRAAPPARRPAAPPPRSAPRAPGRRGAAFASGHAACGRQRPEAAQRAEPDQRIGILERGREGRTAGLGQVGSQLLQGARARDGRRAVGGRELAQQLAGLGAPRRTASKAGVQVWKPSRSRPVPALDRLGRPGGGLVGVAVVAGVGHAEADREVGARDAEAVVVPPVDDHVGRARACGRRRTAPPASPRRGGGARRRRTSSASWHWAQTALPSARSWSAVRVVAVAAGDARARTSGSGGTRA